MNRPTIMHDFGNNTPPSHLWLPFGVYGAISPMANNAFPYACPIYQTVRFVRLSTSVRVSTTNNGTNYWTINMIRGIDSAVICTFNTSAISANVFANFSITNFSIASVANSDARIFITVTKTGLPGTLELTGVLVEVTT